MTVSRIKNTLLWSVILIVILIFCLFAYNRFAPSEKTMGDPRISYEEVLERRDSGEAFILYIHRSSCKICAIVSESLYDFHGHGLPVYSFNMESMMGTREYDEAKLELGFSYMPCFKFYKDGKELAHLNNPLNDSYFDTESGAERDAYRMEMEEKVLSFINAAALGKELISEEPQAQVITGVRVDPPAGE